MLIVGKHATASESIRQEQGMVGHDQVGIRSGAPAVPVETRLRLVVLTVGGQAIVRGRRGTQPEQIVQAVELDLGPIAVRALSQPDEHAQLELDLLGEPAAIGAPARRVEVSVPAAQADVIRPSLQQGRLEVERKPAAHEGDVLCEKLLLERDGVGRDHHPLSGGDRVVNRRHQIGK